MAQTTTVDAPVRERIEELKVERDAVILAHYYVEPEVQAVADYVGDSFYLAKLAKTLPQRTIVLCGVEFMGESAKLLNRDKTVLLPEPAADCPMAHMVKRSTIDAARAEYGDDLAVACYVNSTVEVKSWSDVCVTSSNAVKIVRELPQRHVLFIPDRNLGRFVAEQVPEKHVILNDGCCPRHEAISLGELLTLKSEHPRAKGPRAPRMHRGHSRRGRLHRLHRRDHRVCRGGRFPRVHHRDGARRHLRARAPVRRRRQALLLHLDAPHLLGHGRGHAREAHLLPGDGRGLGEISVDEDAAARAQLTLDRMLEYAAR